MSRLYYEKSATAAELSKGRLEDKKEYLEKVAKLIPSEIIAAYITVVGLIPLIGKESLHSWFFGGIFLLCFILTPIYIIFI